MFTILLDTEFNASHQLTFTDGTQEPMHEHTWKVCVSVSSPKLDENDLVMDFEELKLILESILQDFRGKPLETIGLFEHRNTSAENLAQILYKEVAPKLPDTVHLDYLEVTEAPHCRARYAQDR